MHKSTSIIPLEKSALRFVSSLTAKKGCAAVRIMCHDETWFSWCAISGGRKCLSWNIMKQIISLHCHVASFTHVARCEARPMRAKVLLRQSMGCYANESSWWGKWGLMSWGKKGFAFLKKRRRLPDLDSSEDVHSSGPFSLRMFSIRRPAAGVTRTSVMSAGLLTSGRVAVNPTPTDSLSTFSN